jgi:hypothetical protein
VRTIGPEDPVRFETITLEKVKVAAQAHLHPQMAHDLEVSSEMDYMLNRLVLQVQTHCMSYRDGEDEQEVWSEVEVMPHKLHTLILSASIVLIGSLLLVVDLPYLGALAYAFAVIVSCAYVWSRPFTARKCFKIKATRWQRFPENTVVFPKSLGRPVVQIMLEVPREVKRENDS